MAVVIRALEIILLWMKQSYPWDGNTAKNYGEDTFFDTDSEVMPYLLLRSFLKCFHVASCIDLVHGNK